ncbi:MAG: transglycosylase domain-containing protein, partial [Candidatus Dormibacteraeota bacterium]|nr:transglycosylase domain-containing protein [Candidatus Dormibacteraeota bacterium]
LLAAVVAVVLVLVVGSTVYASAKLSSLPNPGAAPVLAKSLVIYDRNGAVLAERNPLGQFHVVQRLPEMGRWAPLAMVGAEDRDFYRHGALDPTGVVRAVVVDTLARKPAQGGSTLSQQLVKITVLQSDKTFTRKVKEAIIANQLERKYSKDQILEMYLNRVYYGHGAYGIGSATKTYFGAARETRDLTVAQAAFLAGMVQAPSGNDPQVHFDRARSRELYVLDQMVQGGFITRAQSDAAAQEDVRKELVYDTSYRESKAPHFVNYVIFKLGQLYPEALQQGGLSVHTTLDPALQAVAEQAVARGTADMAAMGVNNGDLLAARPNTGEILAWVGSTDYNNQGIGGQFDVVRSGRQPGSSFKPYAYEAALRDRKVTLSSCVQDVPTNFGGSPPYRPLDYDNSFMGTMTVREALLLSRNIPAVQVAQKEGIANVISLARSMGIRDPLPPYLSTSIGGGEVTMLDHLQGYQVFANEGKKVPLISITKIVDSSGNSLFQAVPGQQANQQQVLSPAEAYLVTDVLKGYQNQWHLGWQRQMAGKSGTTGGSAAGIHPDAWMMAYNKDVVVGAWAGNTGVNGAGHPTGAFGVNTGATTLASFINGLPADMNHWYQPPAGVVSRNGEVYLQGTENTVNCSAPIQSQPGPGGGGDKKKHGGEPQPLPPPPHGGGGDGGGA